MRFRFRELPDPSANRVRPRPIVDVVVEGLDIAPQACLLDSGATAIRLGGHIAELCGVDLSDAPETRLAVGGALVRALMAEVSLQVADKRETYAWVAPVWFCEPWVPSFGLLGLAGFFDQFEVTIAAYAEWFELTPVMAELQRTARRKQRRTAATVHPESHRTLSTVSTATRTGYHCAVNV